ncbi:MAG: zinc-ribbon domain-containing protein [Desulfomicrobium sp.]|nr:zinc-ribbon domain-containing protein [Desulfomicrobium sp.]NLV97732.1 hypothetical protein [Desulfovibrionales bacterium]
MEITCGNCNTSFVIPKNRIPDVNKFKLNCPKCREPIVIDKGSSPEPLVPPEHFPHNAVVAFIFVTNDSILATMKSDLESKNIYTSIAQHVTEAVEKIRINYYDIIILEEGDFVKPILDIIKTWNGIRRREVNVIIVQTSGTSLQEQEAFLRGVNAVISRNDAGQISKFLALAMDNYAHTIEPWKLSAQKIQHHI